MTDARQAEHAPNFTLILWISLAVLLLAVTVVSQYTQQSETVEWRTYLLCIVLGLPFIIFLSYCSSHLAVPRFWSVLGLLVAVLLIVMLGGRLMVRGANTRSLVSAGLCLLPGLPLLTGFRRGEGKMPEALVETILSNLVFLTVVASLLDGIRDGLRLADGFPPSLAAIMVFLAVVLYVVHARFSRQPALRTDPSVNVAGLRGTQRRIPTWAWFLLCGIVCLLARPAPILFTHDNFYLGPILDISLGKSLAYDLYSTMGYLVIHFFALVMRPIGITYEALEIADAALCAVVAMVCLAFVRKVAVTRWALFPLLAPVLFIVLSDTDVVGGPVRHCLFVFICGCLVCLPVRIRFAAGCLFSAVALFWAPDTASQVVPAWGATMLAMSFSTQGSLKYRALDFVFRMAMFLIFCCLVCGLCACIEGRLTGGIDAIRSTIGLSLNRTRGWGLDNALFPPYGAFYLAITMDLACAVVVACLIASRSQSKWLPVITFVAMHNLMLLAKVVVCSRSGSDCFNSLLPLAFGIGLAWRVLKEDLKMPELRLHRLFAAPVCLYLAIVGFVEVAWILPDRIQNYPASYRHLFTWAHTLATGRHEEPLLKTIRDDYGKGSAPLAVVSDLYDTCLLLEAGFSNTLPLNPIYMMMDCEPPNWVEYFYQRQIDNLPTDTVIVYSAGRYATEFMSALDQRYEMHRLAIVRYNHRVPWVWIEDPKLGVYSIIGRRTERPDAGVALEWACDEGIAIEPEWADAIAKNVEEYRKAADDPGFIDACKRLEDRLNHTLEVQNKNVSDRSSGAQ